MSKKECLGFFFCLDLEHYKNVKNECVETTSFLNFANNSRSNQNLKNPAHPLVGVGKWETCVKFQQKILNCRVVGALQSFQIFRKIPGSSKTIELCLNFCMTFCIT